MFQDRLRQAIDRFEHLTEQLSEPEVIQNAHRFREYSQERAALEKLVHLAKQYLEILRQQKQNEELLSQGGEFAALAQEELEEIRQRLPKVEADLRFELLPKDPDEQKNIILEIRAGAGGDEAAIFVGDLFRMYTRYAMNLGFKVEILNESFSDRGGYKEVSASVEGVDVYKFFRYESGVHRVQRVPTTEASGRIHTSTVTVAIMPEASEAEIIIDDKDLRIDVFRSSGKGGQGVNKTESAVRITHLPTNTVVSCQDERSQIKNKARAMKVLRARLLQVQQDNLDQQRAATRKAQVGSGERNERIRTYNFPQERITDHRIGLTLKKLSSVMEGNLDEIVSALQQDDYSRRLADAVT